MARNLRTASYTEEERLRLAGAVKDARRAAGFRWRTDLVRAHPDVGLSSLKLVEQGKPLVGETALKAIGRALGEHISGWSKDTPQLILEGGPIPEPKVDEAVGARETAASEIDPDQPLGNYLQSLSGLQVFSDAWLAAVAEELVKYEIDPEETDRFMTMIAQMAGRARAQMREIQRVMTERRLAERPQ